MKILIYGISLTLLTTSILTQAALHPCLKQIERKAVQSEYSHLKSSGQTVASQLNAQAYFSDHSGRNVLITLEDPLDGRWVRYSTDLHPGDLHPCAFQLDRLDETACRYSRDAGPDSLNEIKRISYRSGRKIGVKTRLTSLEALQISKFLKDDLSPNDRASPLADAIQRTDDHSLVTGVVTLPNRKKLTYYGAYGGENSFGMFFYEGTVEVAGNNLDDFVCIR